MIVNQVLSKSSKGFNFILKIKLKNRTKTSQRAAVVHMKPNFQT